MFLRTISLIPVRRPAGKISIRLGPKQDPTDEFKDRANWLLEALNASYSHRAGYCLSPQRAEIFRKLYNAGWDCSRRYFASNKTPYTFSLNDGPEMTLKQALTSLQ